MEPLDHTAITGLAARVANLRAELATRPDSATTHLELVHALAELADAAPDAGDRATQADEPIALLRAATAIADDDELALILTELARLLWWRCLARAEQGDPADVSGQLGEDRDEAVSCLDQVWRYVTETGQLAEFVAAEYPTVARVTDLLLMRAREAGTTEDAATAIEYATAVLDARPAADTDRAISHYQLVIAHSLRGNDKWPAIPHLRALRDMPADRHPWHDDTTVELGIQLAQRIASDPAGGAGDLDEAVGQLSAAAKLTAGAPVVSTPIRFWLAVTRAMRYLVAAGADDDREAAITGLTEAIDAADAEPAAVAQSRTMIAYLRLADSLPSELRAVPENIDYATFKQLARNNAGSTAFAPEGLQEMARLLAEMSDHAGANPAAASMSAVLRTMAGIGRIASGQSSPEELGQVVGLIDDALRQDGLLAEDADFLTVMRAILVAVRGRRDADPVESNQATEQLIELARRMENHPLRLLIQQALGEFASPNPAAPRSIDESADTAQRLERVLDELPDDDPNRAKVLSGLASALLGTVQYDREPAALQRLHDRLLDTVGRPAADDVNAGINHLLLGWVEAVRGTLGEDVELMRSAAGRYQTAGTLLPADHPLSSNLAAAVAALLVQRYSLGGTLEEADAANYYGRRGMSHRSATESGDSDRTDTPLPKMMALMGKITHMARNLDRLTPELIDGVTAAMDEMSGAWPKDMWNPFADFGLGPGGVRWLDGFIGPDGFEFPTGGKRLADFVAAAEAVSTTMRAKPADRIDHLDNLSIAAQADIGAGFAGRDLRRLDRGISTLGPLCADSRVKPRQRMRLLTALAVGLNMRYTVSRDGRDLDNAIDRLEEARRFAEQHPGTDSDFGGGRSGLHELARSYFLRGDPARRDRPRAVATGLASLRNRAEDVLLQTGAKRALERAMSATDEAAEVTRWCVAAGKQESAVRALELGRGMVLHTATVETGVPALLRQAGDERLAAEWERESVRVDAAPWDVARGELDDDTEITLPSDLRRRALAAIEGTELRARLFSPPPVAAIAAALRAAGVTALGYLLPGDEGSAGLAVLVDDTGSVRAHPLPRLRVTSADPIDVFQRSQRDLLRATAQDSRPGWQEWSAALRALCEWAWPAAMGPVLEQLIGVRPGRPVRLVLVPVGRLGAVPWHAAQRNAHGGPRHAGQDAIISYAASARQFVDATRRPCAAWPANPALVRVLDSGLHWDAKEMAELRTHCYPECTYLGEMDEDGETRPVLPSDIATLLPARDNAGASVLHLGCHGSYAEVPVESSLLLDNGTRLQVRDILRHARDRPADAPGGLVVLATCVSDLTDNAHDEALTLASAFLVTGAVGVVGTRWPVDDLPTALFMIMFHHYLNFGYPQPATALRAAQLWMLNPNRTLPPGVDDRLAGPMRRSDLTAVENWAAFTYQGR